MPLLHNWFQDLKIKFLGLKIKFKHLVRNYFFLKNYVTSEEVVSHFVYYQQLSITRYQVRFYANNLLSSYQ